MGTCRIRVLRCELVIDGVSDERRCWVFRDLANLFEAEDSLYGLVPRVEGSCREVAVVFENFLRSMGIRGLTARPA